MIVNNRLSNSVYMIYKKEKFENGANKWLTCIGYNKK